eukprot:g45272.t1
MRRKPQYGNHCLQRPPDIKTHTWHERQAARVQHLNAGKLPGQKAAHSYGIQYVNLLAVVEIAAGLPKTEHAYYLHQFCFKAIATEMPRFSDWTHFFFKIQLFWCIHFCTCAFAAQIAVQSVPSFAALLITQSTINKTGNNPYSLHIISRN